MKLDDFDILVGVNTYATESEYERSDIRTYLEDRARAKMAQYLKEHPNLVILDAPAGKWEEVTLLNEILPSEDPFSEWRHWEYRLLAICIIKEPA